MPFTVAEFLEVFRRYNEAIWPAQLALVMFAAAAVLLAALSTPRSSIAASVVLATLWIWMALAYHLAFFTAINPLAMAFAVAFLVQALLIGAYGVWWKRLTFQVRRDGVTIIAGVIIGYALIVYPVLGYQLGHRYPAAPTFGVPCPTTIFTFGLLVLAKPPLPRVLLVIPCLWALIATAAAVSLGMREDAGLAAAALVVVALTLAPSQGVADGEPHSNHVAAGGYDDSTAPAQSQRRWT